MNSVTVKNIETRGHSLLFTSFFSNKSVIRLLIFVTYGLYVHLNISKCLIDKRQLVKKYVLSFTIPYFFCRETYRASKMYAGLIRLPMARLQISQVRICIINMTSQRESWRNVLLKSVLYIIYI